MGVQFTYTEGRVFVDGEYYDTPYTVELTEAEAARLEAKGVGFDRAKKEQAEKLEEEIRLAAEATAGLPEPTAADFAALQEQLAEVQAQVKAANELAAKRGPGRPKRS